MKQVMRISLIIFFPIFTCTCEPVADTEKHIYVQLGEQQTILNHLQFGLSYFPDGRLLLVQRESPFRLIIPGGISTYKLEGTDFLNITDSELVLTKGDPGSFDNGYAGINGGYRDGSGTIYGYYHAEDQEDVEPYGFYASLGCARSLDNGITWEKLGQVVTSSQPKDYSSYPGQTDKGAGEPCVLESKDKKYLLIYYMEHSRINNRGVQICLARADLSQGPPVGGAFHKYYNGHFDQPGISGLDSVVVSALEDFNNSDAANPSVVYSTSLGVYLMLLTINDWQNHKAGFSGIYFAHSIDGIHFSKPVRILLDDVVPITGESISWHPTVILDAYSDTQGWMVYAYSPKFGVDSAAGQTPYYMVARRITFSK